MPEHNREESVELDGAPDRYATRRRERLLRLSARRVDRRGGGLGWLGGIVLIAISALLLIQNAGYFQQFTNWWPVAVSLFFVFLPRVRKAGVK